MEFPIYSAADVAALEQLQNTKLSVRLCEFSPLREIPTVWPDLSLTAALRSTSWSCPRLPTFLELFGIAVQLVRMEEDLLPRLMRSDDMEALLLLESAGYNINLPVESKKVFTQQFILSQVKSICNLINRAADDVHSGKCSIEDIGGQVKAISDQVKRLLDAKLEFKDKPENPKLNKDEAV